MGPSAAARTYLGSYRLKNCTVRKLPLRKIPFGSCHNWEKALWKVPNIVFKKVHQVEYGTYRLRRPKRDGTPNKPLFEWFFFNLLRKGQNINVACLKFKNLFINLMYCTFLIVSIK